MEWRIGGSIAGSGVVDSWRYAGIFWICRNESGKRRLSIISDDKYLILLLQGPYKGMQDWRGLEWAWLD